MALFKINDHFLSSFEKTVAVADISSINNSMSSFLVDSFDAIKNQCFDVSVQHILFQLANACLLFAYLLPSGKNQILHDSVLVIGFLILSMWAWNVICAPGVFGWNFILMVINIGQTLYLLYNMRQVKFTKELEEVYESIFEPMKVSRPLFKKLITPENAQIMNLQAGESYAIENLTRTDRLGLLISGRVDVTSNSNYLHSIEPKQFLDSPEFESCKAGRVLEEKFNVTITAAIPCKCVTWQRQALDYLLAKETFLANVLSLILARDVTKKLYAMNDKIVTEKGSHLDIRLPSVTTSLCNSATSLNENDPMNDRSPLRPKLGLKIRDRNIKTKKGSRSKSLQTNSLGLAVANSPNLLQRAAAMRFSPKRESLNPSALDPDYDMEIVNVSPTHGVRFKVDKAFN